MSSSSSWPSTYLALSDSDNKHNQNNTHHDNNRVITVSVADNKLPHSQTSSYTPSRYEQLQAQLNPQLLMQQQQQQQQQQQTIVQLQQQLHQLQQQQQQQHNQVTIASTLPRCSHDGCSHAATSRCYFASGETECGGPLCIAHTFYYRPRRPCGGGKGGRDIHGDYDGNGSVPLCSVHVAHVDADRRKRMRNSLIALGIGFFIAVLVCIVVVVVFAGTGGSTTYRN